MDSISRAVGLFNFRAYALRTVTTQKTRVSAPAEALVVFFYKQKRDADGNVRPANLQVCVSGALPEEQNADPNVKCLCGSICYRLAPTLTKLMLLLMCLLLLRTYICIYYRV